MRCSICKKELSRKESIDSTYIGSLYCICKDCTKYITTKKTDITPEEKINTLKNVALENYNEPFLFNYIKGKIEEISKASNIEIDINSLTSPTFSDESENIEGNGIFSLNGARGRHLDVYENKVVITVRAGIGSLLTGNATDGEKTIYFCDCIGFQYKAPGVTLGYIQFETASTSMNNIADNFFNENTFTWEPKQLSDNEMKDVVNYCKERIERYKSGVFSNTNSIADEIMKIKDLLDSGAITQEEYDLLKKRIIG